MAPLVSHARAFRRTEQFKRLWKYTSVSVVSTLVTQVVLFLTYHVWSVGSAVECNIIATLVATVPAYYLNRSWTWGKKGRSNIWGEVVPFWTIALVSMVLSTVAVGVAASNADRITHDSLERALIVNGANLVTYAVLWTLRYLVLNRFLFGTPSGKPLGEQDPSDLELADGLSAVAGQKASAGIDPEPGLSQITVTEKVDPTL